MQTKRITTCVFLLAIAHWLISLAVQKLAYNYQKRKQKGC